ncbi:hypothetical protein I3843_16G113500 [Carya illinoinensis]|nr:hypothetical protein I3843_16G113500 [Carya illinoinensis]
MRILSGQAETYHEITEITLKTTASCVKSKLISRPAASFAPDGYQFTQDVATTELLSLLGHTATANRKGNSFVTSKMGENTREGEKKHLVFAGEFWRLRNPFSFPCFQFLHFLYFVFDSSFYLHFTYINLFSFSLFSVQPTLPVTIMLNSFSFVCNFFL